MDPAQVKMEEVCTHTLYLTCHCCASWSSVAAPGAAVATASRRCSLAVMYCLSWAATAARALLGSGTYASTGGSTGSAFTSAAAKAPPF